MGFNSVFKGLTDCAIPAYNHKCQQSAQTIKPPLIKTQC